MYANDTATQILVAMLKAYGIKSIVASPGMMDACFVSSVQNDPFFKVYSVIDERSAAYFANGLAHETGQPVVITCTGATSSRNYLPGLTEAFYRGLPIIAVTCRHDSTPYSLSPQYLDRSISQNDVKRVSVTLPRICDEASRRDCELYLHVAIMKAMTRGSGPVHINLYPHDMGVSESKLPDVRKIDYADTPAMYDPETTKPLGDSLVGKKVGIFIGTHAKMSEKLTKAIEAFVCAYDAVVFADHASNYGGRNKVMISQAFDIKHISILPDLLIDMGGVCANYSAPDLLRNREIWRISENGELLQRTVGKVSKLFDCPEEVFFAQLAPHGRADLPSSYYEAVAEEVGTITSDAVPFSSTYVAGALSKKLPAHSSLHLAILNSCRNFNMFSLDPSIECTVNAGGFGIDGPVSTLVGQSMANPQKTYFLYVGDLAFFYDMNILGNRHLGANVRILLVNNDGGTEFRVNPWLDAQLGAERINGYISAKGHNGTARNWAEACGFHYMSANDKAEFDGKVDDFCSPEVSRFGKPVLFEILVTHEDEIEGLKQLRRENCPEGKEAYPHALYPGDGSAYTEKKPTLQRYAKAISKRVAHALHKGGEMFEG